MIQTRSIKVNPKIKKYAVLAFKVAITCWAVYAIIKAADLPLIWKYINSVPPANIFWAFVILNIGQVISSMRMRYYFSSAGFKISRKNSILLYFAGNLFNLILPGAIGGDGYKAYLAKKHGNLSLATSVRLMFSNRANGLLILILNCSILALFNTHVMAFSYAPLMLLLLCIVTTVSYSMICKTLLKEPVKVQIGAARYSFFVQLFVIITVWLLLLDRGVDHDIGGYIFMFLLSSVVSVLPFSVGGIGLRELTFFKAAPWFGLDPELGVALCIIYFAINSVSSLVGLVFLPQLKNIAK